MKIYTATSNDIPAIQQIAHDTWPSAYGHILSQQQIDYMMELMYSIPSLQKQMEKGHVFFIAEVNDVPVGFASVLAEGNNVYKLNKLYVSPATQKAGAGKALLYRVIEHAKAAKGQSIQLQVNRHNNAKDFYAKHGFTVIQEADFDIGNGFFMNDYVMELSLVD
jgi:ribosomal protein S18 acetylase RimI-like enzyme